MKTIIFTLLTAFCFGTNPFLNFAPDQKIAIQNAILTKVNGKTISVMDVKKKMDVTFYQNFPDYKESDQARLQFYQASWQRVLQEMIDHELIVAEALDKEIKLSDGDVREAMEDRFGPNVMQTLDNIGLTYDETWKMVKNDLIVQRMTYWFVHSKAASSVTPQDIRQAYRAHLKEHPATTEWKYQVISIRSEDLLASEKIFRALQELNQSPELAKDLFKSFEENAAITVSKEYIAKSEDLSKLHKTSLETLQPGSYSPPVLQMNRETQKPFYRIFYLADKTEFPAVPFETMAAQLKDELIYKATLKESGKYMEKLRKHYGFSSQQLVADDFQPFSLQ